MGLPAIFSGIAGLAGLFGQNQQADQQNNLMQQSLDLQRQGLDITRQLSEPQIAALRAALGLAQNYNPAQEAQAGISRANDIFKNNLAQGLGNAGGMFAGAGGMPGNSSEFGVRNQDVANRVSDPYREYLANALGNPTQMRLNMYKQVLGSAPSGNLADNYFKAAGQNMGMMGYFQPNYGPSMQMLGQGLGGLFPNSNSSGGNYGGTPPPSGSLGNIKTSLFG